MTQEKFQEHVLKELSEIKNLFIKNEQDHSILSTKISDVHSELSTKIESVRTEVESVRTEVESVRTEMYKTFNSFLRWTIGVAISLTGLVFIIAKYIT